MSTSRREQILNAKDIQTKDFTSRFWKDESDKPLTLKLRGISQARRRQLVKDCIESTWNEGKETQSVNNDKLSLTLMIECVLDPATGEQAFGPADREALDGKNAAAVLELNTAVMEVCGFAEPTVLEKNSAKTESVVSPSVSPTASVAPSENSTNA